MKGKYGGGQKGPRNDGSFDMSGPKPATAQGKNQVAGNNLKQASSQTGVEKAEAKPTPKPKAVR